MEKSKVYKIDHHLFFKTISDKFIDLATLDPSYGINESSANHNSRNTSIKQKNGTFLKPKNKNYPQENWDNSPPTDEYFNQVFRISKNQIIWGANYFKQIVGIPFKAPRRNEYQEFIKKYPVGWIIWDKVNSTNDFSDCELAWTSFDKPTFIIEYLWSGMMQGISIKEGRKQKGNKKLNEKRIHPTQKPMPLNYFLLRNYLPKKDNPIVFDPGVGSGGMRIAAWDMNCIFIGCEISDYSFNAQEERFKNHISLLKFDF